MFTPIGICFLASAMSASPVPIILDTDIGGDIDDTWALAMILGTPSLDLKLVVTDYGNTPERTRLVAKILKKAGRTDIPIGTGVKTGDEPLHQASWVGDFDMAAYKGEVYEDGVQALIDTINAQKEPITVVVIGPVPNIKEALRRDPGIAQKARIVSMAGSVYIGYDNSPTPSPEWNVKADIPSWRALIAAPWDITITPLDGCGDMILRGERFAKVAASDHPLARIVIENYNLWTNRHHHAKEASSVLFDTVAVYLAQAEDYCIVKTEKLSVDDTGKTIIDPQGKDVHCHLGWKDRDAFEESLVRALTESSRR